LDLKEVVGAKGFEPSTSWSRTSGQNHISRCPGVTYWFSGRSLMDKSWQAAAGCSHRKKIRIILARVRLLYDGDVIDIPVSPVPEDIASEELAV